MLQATSLVDSPSALRINMSEACVKRMFSQKKFTLQRLDDILAVAQIDCNA